MKAFVLGVADHAAPQPVEAVAGPSPAERATDVPDVHGHTPVARGRPPCAAGALAFFKRHLGFRLDQDQHRFAKGVLTALRAESKGRLSEVAAFMKMCVIVDAYLTAQAVTAQAG